MYKMKKYKTGKMAVITTFVTLSWTDRREEVDLFFDQLIIGIYV